MTSSAFPRSDRTPRSRDVPGQNSWRSLQRCEVRCIDDADFDALSFLGRLKSRVHRRQTAYVLLQLGQDAVLTDPYFASHWFMRFRESVGMAVEELPKLSAIIGGHSVFDLWQPRSLVGGDVVTSRSAPSFTA
ncbi:MAG: hypothetical protein JKY37_19515 [Nannocystaceae bacterium]|nr:hypothetical protein [Nannocystaceae bacterium]